MVHVEIMTNEAKQLMYAKLPKKQLINMLINCNDIIDTITTNEKQIVPTESDMIKCDWCGCKPFTIYTTDLGMFCKSCLLNRNL